VALLSIVATMALANAAHADKTYLFYLHGRIIEEEGVTPTHPTYGLYDYPSIVAALESRGARVLSEARPSDSDVLEYSRQVVSEIEGLLKDGVEPNRIIVAGFSKGGVITIMVSDLLDHPDIRYVIMAACSNWIDSYPQLSLSGRVFSVFEQSDTMAGSCRSLADRDDSPASFLELQISTGAAHGAFYLPRPDWLEPVLDWVHGD
jgi:hypothetical protein